MTYSARRETYSQAVAKAADRLGHTHDLPPKPTDPQQLEQVLRTVRKLQSLLSAAPSESDGDRWWKEIMRKWRNAEPLHECQRFAARKAWVRSGMPIDDGPPDAEALAEREAIQAEGA